MSKKLLFKGGHGTAMTPYEIEDFSWLYIRDPRIDEKTKAYIDSVIGNSVLNLCPYRNVLVTHKYDTVEGNVVTLDDCQDDEIIQLSEIQGNTMVNCNKDTDKELILMPNLDTNGYSNVTLTEGIDGGKVDVSLEGNTMVNVCDQEDPIAITKSYTVETGNHIVLQGEYDGKCRPNIYGNTLVNLCTVENSNVNGTFKRQLAYPVSSTITIICHNLKDFKIAYSKEQDGKWIGNTIISGYKNVITLDSGVTVNELIAGNTEDYNNITYEEFQNLNIVVLEGDYTNKPIPDYFTGMKSSFEDKLVPENLYKFSSRDDFYMLSDNVTLDGEYIKMTADSTYQNAMLKPLSTIKPSTTYTIVIDVVENTLDSRLIITGNDKTAQLFTAQMFQVDAGKTGIFTQAFTTSNDLSSCTRCLVNYLDKTNTTGSIKYRIMVVEEDYTNYDFTNYDSTKGGKYKVDYKVTSKNLFNGKYVCGYLQGGDVNVYKEGIPNNAPETRSAIVKVPKNTDIYMSKGDSSRSVIGLFTNYPKNNDPYTPIIGGNFQTINTGEHNYMVVYVSSSSEEPKLQLEEGTTATTYEPYKESIKTLYLNSPLLEGDTIEQSGNNIIHVHRYKEVVLDGSRVWFENTGWTSDDISTRAFYIMSTYLPSEKATGGENLCSANFKVKCIMGSDNEEAIFGEYGTGAIYLRVNKSKLSTQNVNGFKQYLQQNPVTVVYQLAHPTQEIISTNDNLLLDSYTNGHLDVDTIVPIDKVDFKYNFFNQLKYLYTNTDYIIQFESDNVGKIDRMCLGVNGYITEQNVLKGINKFNITTGDSVGFGYLDIYGIGFNASKIVVTPKVDNDFGYFKGMKSVGECEDNKIEILLQNKNLFDINSWKDATVTTGQKFDINNNTVTILGYDSDTYTRTGATGNNICSEGERKYLIKVKPNTTYTLSMEVEGETSRVNYVQQYNENYTNLRLINYGSSTNDKITFTTKSNCKYIGFRIGIRATDTTLVYSNILLEEGSQKTNYANYNINKKEILLSEPLRGLPNGVKDKYVIINGKWYIERNCIAQQFKDLKYTKVNPYLNDKYPDVIGFRLMNTGVIPPIMCDRFAYTNDRIINMGQLLTNKENINIPGSGSLHEFFITIQKTKLKTLDFNGLMNYFTENPMEIITKATTPTYEPIDYNPFEVYTETTHISNNSNIPCNMVIRNSGFNCILKPNTTYTISSNNGLSTVTTKGSIGDSILRFYNKDTTSITKMNKVLVLEGDYVTGNPPIPAFFKGMESAFEQELVTNENDEYYGKYKVNVKAINKNLFPKDITILENKVWYTDDCSLITVNGYNCINKIIKVLPNTNYSLCCNGKHCEGNIWFYDKDKKPISQVFISPFKTPLNTMYISYHGGSLSCQVGAKFMLTLGNQVEDYIPQEQNNITFYINEPLRGVGDIKDKVYVKEDKVVVERNCSSATLDGSDDESWQAPSNANYKYGVFTLHLPLNHKNVKVDDKNEQGAICNTLIPYWWWTNKDSFETVPDNSIHYLTWENTNTFYIIKKNLRTVDEIKQWLKSNKTEYIYPLKTPTYEEVECDLSKLALEGYNHGTLFYNSNIPVTTQFYDFNVNIKDMLIPNETYYVTFIADRVKDITINLSGVQVNYKTSMGYNKIPIQLGDVVNTNFSMDSKGVELSDLMISTSTSLIYVKDMNDVCIYDEASNKYSITITSTGGNESDKRVILLDYPLLRLNKDIYDKLYYNNKDSRYRIDKKVFKHKFTNDREYSKYAAETNDTYYSSFISFDESIKDYVVITNEKVKTVKVEDDKYYFKIKWSDLGVSDKTEVNGNQGMKDFFNNNEVYLYYATDGFVEIVDGLRRQTLKIYQPETTINFLGNTTTTVTIVIPKKNV